MAKKESHSDPARYTKPELRDKIKKQVTEGDKGGKPGQWSARKAQMVASEYEQEGGGYKQAPDKAQESLQQWGDEKWRTADGKKAERQGGTTRYLPDEAWNKLSKEEQQATNRKKQRGSVEGKQFVANTEKAATARKSAASGKKAAAKHPAAKSSTKAPATRKKPSGESPTGGKASSSTPKKTAAKKTAAKTSSRTAGAGRTGS